MHTLYTLIFLCKIKNFGYSGFMAGSRLFRSDMEIYNWDGQTLCPRTDGDASFNARYAVKHPFFAPILAVCRARAITNPIRQWSSSCYSAYHWLIGLVIVRAQHTAKIGAKSLLVSKKTILFITHLCSETAVFAHFCTVYVFTVNILLHKLQFSRK
jgi:hypothetical protein